MRLYRYTIRVAASCFAPLFLLCLSSACLAEKNNGLAEFDGFWEMEIKKNDGTTERELCDQRLSSSPPYMETVGISKDNTITFERLLFFKKGCLSLKLANDTVELYEGENVLRRLDLLDKDKLQVTFPMNPKVAPKNYRRIPEPPKGLRGGKDSFFATFPKFWKNDDNGNSLNISIDKGEVTLTGFKSEKPFPKKLFLRDVVILKNEEQVLLFFIRYPAEPTVLLLDIRFLDDVGVAEAVLGYGTSPGEKIGYFKPMRD